MTIIVSKNTTSNQNVVCIFGLSIQSQKFLENDLFASIEFSTNIMKMDKPISIRRML